MRQRKTRAYSGDLMVGTTLMLASALLLTAYLGLILHHDCRNFYYQPGSLVSTVCDLVGYNRTPTALSWVNP